MTNCFHLAIPAGNIKTALGFYVGILGCETGNQEEGRWIDINFWGNELTLHETKTKQVRERHDVDTQSRQNWRVCRCTRCSCIALEWNVNHVKQTHFTTSPRYQCA